MPVSMADVMADELGRFEEPVAVGIFVHDLFRSDRFDPFALVEGFARRKVIWPAFPDCLAWESIAENEFPQLLAAAKIKILISPYS